MSTCSMKRLKYVYGRVPGSGNVDNFQLSRNFPGNALLPEIALPDTDFFQVGKFEKDWQALLGYLGVLYVELDQVGRLAQILGRVIVDGGIAGYVEDFDFAHILEDDHVLIGQTTATAIEAHQLWTKWFELSQGTFFERQGADMQFVQVFQGEKMFETVSVEACMAEDKQTEGGKMTDYFQGFIGDQTIVQI